MKKYILSAILASSLLLACHKKAVPVITSRTEFPTPPKSTQPVISPATPEFIAAGKTIYEGKCNRCHDLKAPVEFTAGRWDGILKSMIPKANITDDQAKQVTAYVMANAKK